MAPTPVTALLHAVAVVKAGAFAIIRLTYYCFGTEFLRGTWAQTVVMSITIVTIVYGCSRAVKETHIKRRLAYSTISNLSYILFRGDDYDTPGTGGSADPYGMPCSDEDLFLFLCWGSDTQDRKNFVYELDGLGKKMPRVFGLFTVSALALMGVPGLCGFISKWNLAQAAARKAAGFRLWEWVRCLFPALLTAIYMLTIVVRAFFPAADFSCDTLAEVKDADWYMLLPLFLFAAAMLVTGLYSIPLTEFLTRVSEGVY